MGGQEDQLVDIALRLRAAAGEPASV
nr:hypothetical protein [Nocardioides convexus]